MGSFVGGGAHPSGAEVSEQACLLLKIICILAEDGIRRSPEATSFPEEQEARGGGTGVFLCIFPGHRFKG